MNRYKNVTNPRKGRKIVSERKIGDQVTQIIETEQMFIVEIRKDGIEKCDTLGPFFSLSKAIAATKRIGD
jgi:hypothetical protein